MWLFIHSFIHYFFLSGWSVICFFCIIFLDAVVRVDFQEVLWSVLSIAAAVLGATIAGAVTVAVAVHILAAADHGNKNKVSC